MEQYKAQYEARLVLIHSFLSPFSRNKVTQSSLVLLLLMHPVLKNVIDLCCTALSIAISRSSLLYTFCYDQSIWRLMFLCLRGIAHRSRLLSLMVSDSPMSMVLSKWTLRIPIFVLARLIPSPCCRLFRNGNLVYWCCSLISPKLVIVCLHWRKYLKIRKLWSRIGRNDGRQFIGNYFAS